MVVVLSHGRYHEDNWWAWVPETTTVKFYVDHATLLSSLNVYAVLASGELGPPTEEISGGWCRNYWLSPLEANLISSYQEVNQDLDLHFVQSDTTLCGMATDPDGEGEAAARYCNHAHLWPCGGLLETLGKHEEIVILCCRAVGDTSPEDPVFGGDPDHWQADFTENATRFVSELLALAWVDEPAAMEQLKTLDARDIEILRGAVPDFAHWYDSGVVPPSARAADSEVRRPPARPDDEDTQDSLEEASNSD